MTKKTRQAYQYEAPVTPSKWTGEEQRFSIRVKAVLEDLYQKFSGLSAKLAGAGDGMVRSVNGKEPDEAGNVALDAADVSARPSDWMPSAADVGALPASEKAQLLLSVYPVGSIYLSVNSTSPASLFGGTWEQLKDRFLLGAGGSYSLSSVGGEAVHTLTINEMPSHAHSGRYLFEGQDATVSAWGFRLSHSSVSELKYPDITEYTGGNQPHNNMPPYLAVYMWKRIA